MDGTSPVLVVVLVLVVGAEFASVSLSIVTLAYSTTSLDFHESILSIIALFYQFESYYTSSTGLLREGEVTMMPEA